MGLDRTTSSSTLFLLCHPFEMLLFIVLLTSFGLQSSLCCLSGLLMHPFPNRPEFPHQHIMQFCRDLVMSYSLALDVLKRDASKKCMIALEEMTLKCLEKCSAFFHHRCGDDHWYNHILLAPKSQQVLTFKLFFFSLIHPRFIQTTKVDSAFGQGL